MVRQRLSCLVADEDLEREIEIVVDEEIAEVERL